MRFVVATVAMAVSLSSSACDDNAPVATEPSPPRVTGMGLGPAVERLEDAGFEVRTTGKGIVVEQRLDDENGAIVLKAKRFGSG